MLRCNVPKMVLSLSKVHVSVAIKILTNLRAPFTVKIGWPYIFFAGSNIQDGLTIDLCYLNSIEVAADRKTVSIGPGNRWINVSEALDSPWSAGASPIDLYWALRGGGGSNFGLVTRFDLATYEQGLLWASSLVFPGDLNTTLIPSSKTSSSLASPPTRPPTHTSPSSISPPLGAYIIPTDQYYAHHRQHAAHHAGQRGQRPGSGPGRRSTRHRADADHLDGPRA
ncbi:hypothetical protein B0H67DRAFT_662094 [Lasiosphaeris hirsuta]|uniref:Uncharacterized protein n=1 Tax=Lasiosphaeris hirsuta TaxID=260670 RepID=A0AA40AQF8_9PEZI|nr:hypothetical protein B0H67DRAFT_662094 [Lasiosphaeris hirsuta]